MFPFTITQERTLGKINNLESTILIEALKKELIRLKIDRFEYNDVEIDFKNPFFNGQGRNHLMSPVDKGSFKIDKHSDRFIYSYSLLRMFYITTGMSVFVGLMSRNVSIFLLFFLVLFGVNWFITLIRHMLFMNRLKKIFLKLEKTSASI